MGERWGMARMSSDTSFKWQIRGYERDEYYLTAGILRLLLGNTP